MKTEDTYYDDLVKFILAKWKKKGTVKDPEETKAYIEAMLFLISGYRFKCLIATLFDVLELMEEFDEKLQGESK